MCTAGCSVTSNGTCCEWHTQRSMILVGWGYGEIGSSVLFLSMHALWCQPHAYEHGRSYRNHHVVVVCTQHLHLSRSNPHLQSRVHWFKHTIITKRRLPNSISQVQHPIAAKRCRSKCSQSAIGQNCPLPVQITQIKLSDNT